MGAPTLPGKGTSGSSAHGASGGFWWVTGSGWESQPLMLLVGGSFSDMPQMMRLHAEWGARTETLRHALRMRGIRLRAARLPVRKRLHAAAAGVSTTTLARRDAL